jgi:ATP-binding cassette subfamily B protein
VRHAEQIVVMDGGRVAERGTHEQLLADAEAGRGPGIYANLWNLQLRDKSDNLSPSLPLSPASVSGKEPSNGSTSVAEVAV